MSDSCVPVPYCICEKKNIYIYPWNPILFFESHQARSFCCVPVPYCVYVNGKKLLICRIRFHFVPHQARDSSYWSRDSSYWSGHSSRNILLIQKDYCGYGKVDSPNINAMNFGTCLKLIQEFARKLQNTGVTKHGSYKTRKLQNTEVTKHGSYKTRKLQNTDVTKHGSYKTRTLQNTDATKHGRVLTLYLFG